MHSLRKLRTAPFDALTSVCSSIEGDAAAANSAAAALERADEDNDKAEPKEPVEKGPAAPPGQGKSKAALKRMKRAQARDAALAKARGPKDATALGVTDNGLAVAIPAQFPPAGSFAVIVRGENGA